MRDHFSDAVEEQAEKSPFVCVSCGHPARIAQPGESTAAAPGTSLHDQFSEAVMEEEEKSAFVCETCKEWVAARQPERH